MITKSDFLLFLQAPMHLWASKNNQLEILVPSVYNRHLMEQGKDIEKIAKEFMQNYLAKKYNSFTIETEQTFTDGHFQTRVDALVHDTEDNVYDIYEIKSSTSVKKEHIYDVTFQRLVCEASIAVRNVFLVHVNKEYIRMGDLDLDQFFEITDLNEEIDKLRTTVSALREKAWKVTTNPTPGGILECVKPKVCPSPKLCHPILPEYPIYDLPRLFGKKARDLKAQGVLAIKDIPEGYELSDRQNQHVEAVKWGEPLIDHAAINTELAKLEYPLYFLDYETYAPGIPAYDGYKPFQQMVFQYSLHVFDAPESDPKHFEFLATEASDPGIKLAAHLAQHIGETGSVIVWNTSFESGRNKEMAQMYPDYSEFLLSINDRIFDLMVVFSKGYYIDPDFHGSASIKNVLPVIAADYGLEYDKLAIQRGDEAMIAWAEIIAGTISKDQIEQSKQDLLDYCELDTMAMVKIWEALQALV